MRVNRRPRSLVASDSLTCVFHGTGNTLVRVAFAQSEIGPCYKQLCDTPHSTPGVGGGGSMCTNVKPIP
jgi:hypothetical protein